MTKRIIGLVLVLVLMLAPGVVLHANDGGGEGVYGPPPGPGGPIRPRMAISCCETMDCNCYETNECC